MKKTKANASNILLKELVLFFLLIASTCFAAEAFCKTCDIPILLVTAKGTMWPGQVNVTAKLFSLQVPESSDATYLIDSVKSGKISADELNKIAGAKILADQNIVVYYNYTDLGGASRETTLCPAQKTNASGEISCDAIISQSGCGTIIVRFISSDPKLVSTETGTSYCVAGEIPISKAIDKNVCLVLFIILGILIASLYASGKSPLATIDITTPKRPAGFGYFPGFLSSKYQTPPIGKAKVALSAKLLTSRLLNDKMVTKGELKGIMKGKTTEQKHDALLRLAVKTNLDRVKRVNVIDDQLNKLYPKVKTYGALKAKAMTPKLKRKSEELAKEIKSLEEEKRRKLDLINQINNSLKASMQSYLASTTKGDLHPWGKLNTETLKNLKDWMETAKMSLSTELKKGEDITVVLNQRMKVIATKDTREQLNEIKEIENRIKEQKDKKQYKISIPKELFKSLDPRSYNLFRLEKAKAKNVELDLGRFDTSKFEKLIDDRKKKTETEIANKESLVDFVTPIFASKVKAEFAETGIEKELKKENAKSDENKDKTKIRYMEEISKNLKDHYNKLDSLFKAVEDEISQRDKILEIPYSIKEFESKGMEKEYNEKLAKWAPPGTFSLPPKIIAKLAKSEKEKMLDDLITYEENKSNAKCVDILVSEGVAETIKTAGIIEVAKIKLGKDIEKEGVD